MTPLAVSCCLVMVACAARPGLAWSALIFAVSGALNVYQITVNTRFVRAAPPERRGEAFGVAGALIWTAYGAAFLLAGAATSVLPPSAVIAVFAGAGAAAAAALGFCGRRILSPGSGQPGGQRQPALRR